MFCVACSLLLPCACGNLRQAIASGAEIIIRTRAIPGSAFARRPEIMLGVLITILGFNHVAVRSGLACERHVALIVSVRISSTVLALPHRAALTTRRSSLRPMIAAPHVIHSLDPGRQPSRQNSARTLEL